MNPGIGRRVEVGPNISQDPDLSPEADASAVQPDRPTAIQPFLGAAVSALVGQASDALDGRVAHTPPVAQPRPPRGAGESQEDYETRIRFGR